MKIHNLYCYPPDKVYAAHPFAILFTNYNQIPFFTQAKFKKITGLAKQNILHFWQKNSAFWFSVRIFL